MTWWTAGTFLAGTLLGAAVASWGAWLAFRDNARRYFAARGFGAGRALEEANKAMGVEWYDPRDLDDPEV
jgi:hypothetical protein